MMFQHKPQLQPLQQQQQRQSAVPVSIGPLEAQSILINQPYRYEFPVLGSPDTVEVEGVAKGRYYYDWDADTELCAIVGNPTEFLKDVWTVVATKDGVETTAMLNWQVIDIAPQIVEPGIITLRRGEEFSTEVEVINRPTSVNVRSILTSASFRSVKRNERFFVNIFGTVPRNANFSVDESVFTIDVGNTGGKDNFDAPFRIVGDSTPVAPDSVESLGFVRGDTTLLLSWTAGDDGGSPILRYEVRIRAGANGVWSEWMDSGSNLNHEFTGLMNGTEYFAQVRAVSAIGTSAESSIISAIPAGIGEAPTITESSGEGTTITLSWTAGDFNGGTLQEWEYRLKKGDADYGTWTEVEIPAGISVAGETDFEISNLEVDSIYAVQVRTVTGVGTSAPSNEVIVDLRAASEATGTLYGTDTSQNYYAVPHDTADGETSSMTELFRLSDRVAQGVAKSGSNIYMLTLSGANFYISVVPETQTGETPGTDYATDVALASIGGIESFRGLYIEGNTLYVYHWVARFSSGRLTFSVRRLEAHNLSDLSRDTSKDINVPTNLVTIWDFTIDGDDVYLSLNKDSNSNNIVVINRSGVQQRAFIVPKRLNSSSISILGDELYVSDDPNFVSGLVVVDKNTANNATASPIREFLLSPDRNIRYMEFSAGPVLPPTFTQSPAQTATEQTTWTYDLNQVFTGATSFAVQRGQTLPSYLSLSGSEVSGTLPNVAEDTTVTIQITATNPQGSVDGTVTLLIQFVPPPPTYTAPAAQSVGPGGSWTLDVSTLFTGATGYAFKSGYSAPAYLSLAGTTLSIATAPIDTSETMISVPITATGPGGSVDGTIMITVRAASTAEPPTFTAITANRDVRANNGYNIQIFVNSDLPYALTLRNSPSWVSARRTPIGQADLLIINVPGTVSVGDTFNVTAVATSDAGQDTLTLTLTIIA